MNPPKKLYKYEAFNEQSLRNLKRQGIYFGSPTKFNDPYDCALTANIKDPQQEDLDRWLRFLLDDIHTPASVKNDIKNRPADSFKFVVKDMVEKSFLFLREKFVSSCGITCLSEVSDDLLMWSHYGGRYKGFCLEFDTAQEPFNKAMKVKYSHRMPEVDPLDLLNKEDSRFMDLLLIKSKSWEYEKEWRVFHHSAGTLFTYPPEALTGVFFGPDIEMECLEIIALILKGQNETVKLYRGRRSDKEFKVEHEEINYTTYIEAKKKGLR